MSKVVWLGEVEWLGEVNCFTKCGWTPGQPDPGGFKQKCVNDCVAQQVPAAEWPAATEFQEPKVPDPKCLTDCENKWGIASGSWNAAELAKCVQACKVDVPSVVQPPVYTNLPQAETPPEKTCGPNEILVNGACVPAPQMAPPPTTSATAEKKTPWGLIILGGLAVAGAAAWAMGAFGGAGLAGLAENPEQSSHRAHPTKYKVSARVHGSSSPLRTWGPYDTKAEALSAISQKRDEARRQGWNLVFDLVHPTSAWGSQGPLRGEGFERDNPRALPAANVDLNAFFNAYVEAALWSSTDESDESGGEPLDKNYGPGDFTKEALKKMRRDADSFARAHASLIEGEESRAGHDFWLTRNGHGAGFWDGDWPEPAATVLTKAAEAYGEQHLYVHRKKIHVM